MDEDRKKARWRRRRIIYNNDGDDVKEVKKGYDCGLQIKNYNDIREGDVVEAFREVEVKKTLKSK